MEGCGAPESLDIARRVLVKHSCSVQRTRSDRDNFHSSSHPPLIARWRVWERSPPPDSNEHVLKGIGSSARAANDGSSVHCSPRRRAVCDL